MNQVYIIQFSVVKDEAILVERIKALGRWMSYFSNSIIVESGLTSTKEIYEKISLGFEKDRILIIELKKTSYWGVMPQDAWNWLKSV